MGMVKKGTAVAEKPVADQTEGVAVESPESGAKAAIARLSTSKVKAAPMNPVYKARDYDAEALGKTRCVQFEAALMSPAIAGMKFDTMDQYLVLVKQAADAGVAYSFQK